MQPRRGRGGGMGEVSRREGRNREVTATSEPALCSLWGAQSTQNTMALAWGLCPLGPASSWKAFPDDIRGRNRVSWSSPLVPLTF